MDVLIIDPVPTEKDDAVSHPLAEGDGVSFEIPRVFIDTNGVPELKSVCDEKIGDPLVLIASSPHGIEVHLFESGPAVCGLPLRTLDRFRFWHTNQFE